jgi:hypothetical protein
MITRLLAKSLYGLFAALYLVSGAGVLLLGTGLLPDPVRGIIADVAQENLNSLHILQEFGSLLVFAGLITLWFIRHYAESRPFHWAMTAFWGLFALVHWFDIRGPAPSALGPTINTVPFLLFAGVGLLRLRSERAGQTPDKGNRV